MGAVNNSKTWHVVICVVYNNKEVRISVLKFLSPRPSELSLVDGSVLHC